MLVLMRRIGESIYVGEDIKVRVCRINGNQVAIGIAAPKDTVILREEIIHRLSVKDGFDVSKLKF